MVELSPIILVNLVGFSLFKEHVSDLLFVEDGSTFPFKAISYGFHFNEFGFPPHLVSLCILSNC